MVTAIYDRSSIDEWLRIVLILIPVIITCPVKFIIKSACLRLTDDDRASLSHKLPCNFNDSIQWQINGLQSTPHFTEAWQFFEGSFYLELLWLTSINIIMVH